MDKFESELKVKENKLIDYVLENLETIDEIKEPREKASKIVDVVKLYFTTVVS